MRARQLAWLTGLVAGATLSGCGSDGGTSSAGSGATGGTGGTAGTGGAAGSGASAQGGSGAGGSAGVGGTGGSGGATAECGNGTQEGDEACDDGNAVDGDGCQADCTLTCETAADCDDANPCNGAETCGSDNVCAAGTPPAEGSDCGTDSTCIGGNCVSASCGDGAPQSGEECDDGNITNGDGCDMGCVFSCVSTDTARDCSTVGGECEAPSTCNDTTHTCEAGAPLSDGTACGASGDVCFTGTCITPNCGNGTPEPGEACDDGNTDDTDGCTQACAFTCTSATDCDDGILCTSDSCDTGTHTCSTSPDASQNGNACNDNGTAGTCDAGNCVAAGCGNGNIDSGEECDNGPGGQGAGTGCTNACQFECDVDNDCGDGNVCNGTETCSAVSGGRTCSDGSNASQGTVCGSGPRRICDGSGSCNTSTCGDGFLDTGGTEQCEPPNTATCDANCQDIVAVVCGNGNIEAGEQCDDNNTNNLDGCDSSCQYEVLSRFTSVAIAGGQAPTGCTPRTNALGNAVGDSGIVNPRTELNNALQDGVNEGSTNIIAQALGLDDLTGTADASMQLGVLSGAPDPADPGGAWPMTGNPQDWSFLLDSTALDGNNRPTSIMDGSIAAQVLTAGPNDVFLNLVIAGSPAQFEILNARVTARINPPPNVPPSPWDNLASGLQVFQTLTANGSGQGLCGNITVESLASIPVPEILAAGGGQTACRDCPGLSKEYTYCGADQPVTTSCNSLLDVFVGGCRGGLGCSFIPVQIISSTQPDVGSGPNLTLDELNGTKVGAAQTTGNRDAYSAFLPFEANRAHASGTQ